MRTKNFCKKRIPNFKLYSYTTKNSKRQDFYYNHVYMLQYLLINFAEKLRPISDIDEDFLSQYIWQESKFFSLLTQGLLAVLFVPINLSVYRQPTVAHYLRLRLEYILIQLQR